MPYSSIDELPSQVQSVPAHGKEIFLAAFNSAYDSTCKDKGDQREQCSFQVAWSAVGQKYEKQGDSWIEKKSEIKSSTKEDLAVIVSSLTETPKFTNGAWIPILRDGQSAFNSKGIEFILTKEAIDRDYKSYIGGYFDINHNHDDKINGRIVDMRREGNLASAKIDGFSDDALKFLNSSSYRGVSQESKPLEVIEGSKVQVKRFQGQGVAVIMSPHQPACSREQGCGTVLSSAIPDTGYTADEIKKMLSFMKSHPEMMDDSMREMMKEMAGVMNSLNFSLRPSNFNSVLKDTGGINSKMTDPILEQKATTPEPATKFVIQSSDLVEELKQKNALIETLQAKIADLEKGQPIMLQSAITAALKEQADQQASAAKHKEAVTLLKSSMRKENAEKFLSTNPNIDQIMSMVDIVKGVSTSVGAGSGEMIESSKKETEEDKIKNAVTELRLRSGLARRVVKR